MDVDAGCGQLKSVIEKRRRKKSKEEAEPEMVFSTDEEETEGTLAKEEEQRPIDLDEVDAEDVETYFDEGEVSSGDERSYELRRNSNVAPTPNVDTSAI